MVYRFGTCMLDIDKHELTRDRSVVPVEPQVFAVLVHLLRERDRVVSRDELIEAIWEGRFVSDSAVSSRVKSARQAIGDDGKAQKYIKTVHGHGFRFVADAEETEAELAERTSPYSKNDTEVVPGAEPVCRSTQQRIEFCTAPDGTGLAYSLVGEGPPLVKTANWLNHLEYEWESPIWRHWIDELSRNNTLLRYDERGNGLSDWNPANLSFDAFVEDLETVIDAAGFERFDMLGISQGCAVAIAYAVRHPHRVRRLVLYGGYSLGWAKRNNADELAQREAMITLTGIGWGQNNPAFRQMFTSIYFPYATDEQARWFNELQRISTSPEGAQKLQRALGAIDVRHLLRKVQTPALVMHCRDDSAVPFEAGRILARFIPGARFVALDSPNHLVLDDEAAWPRLVSHLRDFLEGPDI